MTPVPASSRVIDETEGLLRSLPLPLAQLLRRAVNGKSGVERHNNAYYLAEATLKLVSAMRIGVWLEHALDPRSDLARELEALTLPSAGHWLALLRDVDAALAKRPDIALLPLGEVTGGLARRKDGWGAVAELARAAADASAVSAEIARAAVSQGILGFFGLVVAYRNEVMGHGAQRRASFYETFSTLWTNALVEVLNAEELFGGLRLGHARLRNEPEPGATTTIWQDLTGCASFPMKKAPTARSSEIVPGRLYFVGPAGVIPIHPVVIYREHELGHESVGFLNRTSRRTTRDGGVAVEEIRRVDFLDYATGENLREVDAREAIMAVLSRLRGKQLSPDDARAIENATAAAAPDEPIDEVMASGASLGDFELLEEVGRGGMGIVYRARQRSLNRIVALKVLPPSLATDAATIERFRREVAALARCDHPNVVKVLTSGVDGERHYFAMEYVEGADLGKAGRLLSSWRSSGTVLDDGHLAAAASVRDPSTAVPDRASKQIALATGEAAPAPMLERKEGYHKRLARLFAGAARGLQHLHERGIIHRDIKPGNVMLTVDGQRLVLMDLGLAKLADESRGLTRSDLKVLGTLRYMPPEQLVRKLAQVDARVDSYALGATLYELSTGRPLHDGETEAELVQQVLTAEPTAAHRAERSVPRDLSTILTVATAKDRNRRYATAQALAEDLEAFATDRPIRASPPGIGRRLALLARRNRAASGALAALALLSLGGAGGWWWWTTDHVYDCANVASRWGVLSCVGRVSRSEARHRDLTYRFSERRGHVVEVNLLNGRGGPDGALEEVSRWEYTYRDDGKVQQVLERNRSGDFVRRQVFSDDLSRIDLRDRNGQPSKLPGSDISTRIVTWSSKGYVAKSTFANVYGSPRQDSNRVFGYSYEVDDQGMPIRETCLSSSGAPTVSRKGYVSIAITRDALGTVTSLSYLDASGQLVTTSDGFAKRSSRLDEHGREVERSFADSRGLPSRDKELGAARLELRWDDRGGPVEYSLFSPDGMPDLGTEGWARKVCSYDDRGQEIERRLYAVDRTPRPGAEGYAHLIAKWDAHAHQAWVRFYGTDDKPILDKNGAAGFTYRYDDRGELIERTSIGIDSGPILSKYGYATVTAQYDERGDELERSYLGTDGKPIILADLGYSRMSKRYDERGNEVERTFRGVDGAPIALKTGGGPIAGYVFRYDERGNEIEASFFGVDHYPVESSDRCFGFQMKYDELDRMEEKRCLSAGARPTNNRFGFALQTWKYDENGHQIREEHRDVEGRLAVDDDGTSGWVKTYDAFGREVTVTYVGVDGKPTARKDGAIASRAWSSRAWGDAEDKVLRRIRYDVLGVPTSGAAPEFDWRTESGELIVTDNYQHPLADAVLLASIEAKIHAWNAGLRMALLRDKRPEVFGGAVGALVVTVASDGDAKHAGLTPGDVILEVDGRKVLRPEDVQTSIDLGSGARRPMLVLRDGSEVRLDVGPGVLGAELEPE